MLAINQEPTFRGPITTANAQAEGRLMVDVGGMKKKKRAIIKKHLKK